MQHCGGTGCGGRLQRGLRKLAWTPGSGTDVRLPQLMYKFVPDHRPALSPLPSTIMPTLLVGQPTKVCSFLPDMLACWLHLGVLLRA